MVNASSHLSRLRACRRSARSCGRWIALMASSLGHRSCCSRTSAGQRVLARRPGSRARRRCAGRSSTSSAWRSPGRPGSARWRTRRRAPWSAARRRRDREQLVLGVHQLAAAAEAGHRARRTGRARPAAAASRESPTPAKKVSCSLPVPSVTMTSRRCCGPRPGGAVRRAGRDWCPDHAGHGHPGEHGDVVALAAASRAGSARPWCSTGAGSGAAGHRPSAGRRPSRTCRSSSCPAAGPADRAAWSHLAA